MILATNNKGKLMEIKKILKEYQIYSLRDKNINIDVIEDENTYNLFKYNVILNSSAMFDENNKIVGGNATERALLSLVNTDEYKKITGSATIVNKKSFNSANKFSAVETKYNGETFTYYKGAPERLIDAATKCVTLNGLEPIDKDKLKMIVRSYTIKAMRVIATGYSSSKLPEEGFPDDLVITSLVAIRDDVRPGSSRGSGKNARGRSSGNDGNW